MNILIIGCGETGAQLAGDLSREGHTVSVVDRDPSAADRLPGDYTGYFTAGIPIDQGVLCQAGIESCDALAAVCPDDNVNIMACQIAREYFHIKNILARVGDPQRESIFSHGGLRTICPTLLTVDRIKKLLVDHEEEQRAYFGISTAGFRYWPVPKKLFGVSTTEIDPGSETIFGVLHEDHTLTLVPAEGCVLKPGDSLVLARVVD